MPNATQTQFDGQTPVPGYTLFKGKDGQSSYLKGEGLSDAAIASKVATLRGASLGVSQGAPDANAQAQEAVRKPLDQLQEKRYSIFTPTGISGTPDQLKSVENANNAALVGATGLAVAAPAVAGALAPTVAGTETVGTGILDSLGNEITREVARIGPSAAREALNNPVVQKVLWHVAGSAAAGAGVGGTFALLKKIGVF